MAKLSKFVKVDKNILLEYVYDGDNNIGEAYEVLVNSKERRQSYLATPTSGTNNTSGNSLFLLDKLSNKYGKINTAQYSFLQIRNYGSSSPIRHDRLIVHLPINWTFGEYLGFYVRVYAFDVLNQKTYDISNFYFDMSDSSQSYLLNFTSPPLLFAEKLWGKNLQIDFPSVSAIASQRVNNRPKENSINANLSSGSGMSLNSPVFIDFHFINNIQTVNGVSTYTLEPKVAVSVPQTPEFENLGLKIEHSKNGDFFEIYGTYNGTIAEFKQFIDDSYNAGSRYYVQYSITTYEQNIRGKTITAEVTDNFNETIEFRPIIKYSTTTALIDVEMRLIDAVDESTIIRRATYGMLQDEVSRYSLNLIKINLKNANKPKIYNVKNPIDKGLVGLSNSMGKIYLKDRLPSLPPITNKLPTPSEIMNTDPNSTGLVSNSVSNISQENSSTVGMNNSEIAASMMDANAPSVQQIKVDRPVFYDKYGICLKSDKTQSELLNAGLNWFLEGQITIVINSEGNTLINFEIARNIKFNQSVAKPEPFNLSGFSEILFVIKNDRLRVEVSQYLTANSDPKQGQVAFNIPAGRFSDIKAIFNSKEDPQQMFYIVGKSAGNTFPMYKGLFMLADDKKYQETLKAQQSQLVQNTNSQNQSNSQSSSAITIDPALNAPVTNNTSTTNSQSMQEIGNTPKPKPTLNKEIIDKIKNGGKIL